MPRFDPGTRWLRRSGKHANSEVEITSTNEVSVFFINRGGGNKMGNQKVDPNQTHTTSRELFAAQYIAKDAVGFGVHTGGRAFRHVYQPSERQADLETMPRAIAPQTNGRNGHVTTTDGPLTIALEDISPALAQSWLDRGGLNRKKSERNIVKLLSAIQMGEWNPYTGETIKLRASDDTVGDGQHRLEAIARSGMTVKCLVVRGIPDEAFDVIDTGRARNAPDVLSIHGHVSTISLSTAARGLILIERYGRHNAGSTKDGFSAAPSNAAILAYVEAHPEVADAVRMGDRVRKEGKFVGGSGLWAVAFTMFMRLSREQTEVFVNSLIDGASLEPGSPILRLRAMYVGNRDWTSSQDARERLLAVVIKGWNSWRRDELVQMISWHDRGRGAEKFPVAE